MAKDSAYLPDFKDQVAPDPTDYRPPHDPDGLLLAGGYTTRAALSPASVLSETIEPLRTGSSNNIVGQGGISERIKPQSTGTSEEDHPSASATSVTDVPIAFAVTDADAVDTPAGNINNNNRNESSNPTQTNRDSEKKPFPWKAAIAWASVIVVVVAGAVVGGVCSTGGCGGGGTTAEADPTVSNTTPLSPTPATASTREHTIRNFINSNSYMSVELLPTGTSPEEQALHWLINYDPLQLNIGDDNDELRILQRYSLLTLWFQGETGTAWYDSTNWLNDNECSWFGIGCGSGVVTVVDFAFDDLQGTTLSPDLGLLSDLAFLDLSYTLMSGSLPTEIGLWTSLKSFQVQSNSLTGSIPETIANWTMIEEAWFAGNNFAGSMPDGICEFISGEDSMRVDCELPCSCCTSCA